MGIWEWWFYLGAILFCLSTWRSRNRTAPTLTDQELLSSPVIKVRFATAPDIPALVELMSEFYAESSFPLDENRPNARSPR